MKFPNNKNLEVSVVAYCHVNPSEDVQKVKHALGNILDNIEFDYDEYTGSLKAASQGTASLSRIYEVIMSRDSAKVYKKHLDHHLQGDSSWFYLNKQAAYVGVIAICEEEEESPLGPIKITLTSKNIADVIKWLTTKNHPTENNNEKMKGEEEKKKVRKKQTKIKKKKLIHK